VVKDNSDNQSADQAEGNPPAQDQNSNRSKFK